MKNKTRLFALLLTALFILTAALPVFADETTPSITVNNAAPGSTYHAYKLLDLGEYDVEKNQYFYTIADGWKDFFLGDEAPAKDYVTMVGDYVYPSAAFTDDTVGDFADLAKTYAADNSIAPAGSAEPEEKAASATIEVADLGYYLVDSEVGAVCALTTAKPTAEINEKNELPTIEKQTSDGKDYAVAQIGDVIDFTLTVHAVNGNTDYTVVDTMVGLEYVDGSAALTSGTLGKDAVTYSNGTLTITLPELTDDAVITYQATVTAAAITGANNTAILEYTNTFSQESESKDELTVYTWEVAVYKYAGDITENKDYPLAGAEFGIYTDADCTQPLFVTSAGENAVRPMTAKEIAEAGEGTLNTFITGESGRFKIQGLGNGTFYLKEENAPEGYNALEAAIPFTVSSSEEGGIVTQTLTVGNSNANEIDIQNVASGTPLLPETGGVGTVAFVLIGCVVFIGTAVILVTKKRMYNEG